LSPSPPTSRIAMNGPTANSHTVPIGPLAHWRAHSRRSGALPSTCAVSREPDR
jgi:hypothetical protein